MKVCESWLREWGSLPLTGKNLADKLTMAGIEVDALTPVAAAFDRVVVAEVIRTWPHPQADRLTLCEVNHGGSGYSQVVCGAKNVRAGLRVAMATLGASLPNGLHIKETKLRGELSQGMLCSSAELGIEDDSEGILELPDNAPIGMDFREYYQLDDLVYDLDLTPNRADCFSVLGVAREIAALHYHSLKTPEYQPAEITLTETIPVHVTSSEACPYYCARVMRNINGKATTPVWMKERLRRAGVRLIHPVVDVTNYVMLELGQPMHAFDLEKITGGITVRYSQPGEQLTLLDGQQKEFNTRVLLIADDSKPLALAGIMGGEDSAVQEDTCHIVLESAFFQPTTIAGVARRYGLSTDSSQRFERGVDASLPLVAMERATRLLHEIVGGEVGAVQIVCDKQQLPCRREILFNPNQVAQLTGVVVATETMQTILQSLGMVVVVQGSIWHVTPPLYRFDLSLEVDLVEEIIRVYGYDKLHTLPIPTEMKTGTIDEKESFATRCADSLISRGYHETISYSFVDPDLQAALYPDASVMQLVNPISQELSQMRVGMWPGLIASMMYNMNRQQTAIKLFESGVVFDCRDGQVLEQASIAALLTGEAGGLNWSEATRRYDFYDLKGDLQALLCGLHLGETTFVSQQHPALHPGQTAQIFIDNVACGWIGVLHPLIADQLDISQEVILFELGLAGLTPKPTLYQPISKYPQIRRDLSLLADKAVTAAAIERTIRTAVTEPWLKALHVFDVYTGAGIPGDKKSLAVALILQNEERTLVDVEINILIDAILKKLEEEFAIILRESL